MNFTKIKLRRKQVLLCAISTLANWLPSRMRRGSITGSTNLVLPYPWNYLPAGEEQKLAGLVNLEIIQYKANLKRQGSEFDPKTAEILSTVLRELGEITFNRGVDYALSNVYTNAQAAEKLGVSKRLVIRLAHKMNVGKKVSEVVFIFSNRDIEVMEARNRVAGRQTARKTINKVDSIRIDIMPSASCIGSTFPG
jgi:hypothetical protein